jgi:iron complex outermembrane receptor protein
MRNARCILLIVFACITTTLWAQAQPDAPPPNNVFAQKLADEFTAKYLRLISIGIHAQPPTGSGYQIVAHTLRKKVGDKSTPEDLEVMRTGKPDGPNLVEGGIYDVAIQLFDSSHNVIGVIAVHIKPGPGDPKAETLALAYKIRDDLATHIPSSAKLFEHTTLSAQAQ